MSKSDKYQMSYRLMMKMVEMVEAGAIKKDHPLFEGDYEGFKRELMNTKANE